MEESLQAIEAKLQTTVTLAERRCAQRDAWQVLQLLRLQEPVRDQRLEAAEVAAGDDGSEVA